MIEKKQNLPLFHNTRLINNNHFHLAQISSTNRIVQSISCVVILTLLSVLSFHLLSVENTSKLAQSIQIDNVMEYLRELESIALQNPNHSRSVENAFNQSAEYVISKLEEHTDCDMQIQPFKVPVWDEQQSASLALSSPFPVKFQPNVDFKVMRYGGSRPIIISDGHINAVPNGGCKKEDFNGVKDGYITLISADLAMKNCGFWESAYRAQSFKAAAVLFYNEERTSLLGSRVRIVNWKEGDPLMDIPVLSVLQSVGNMLINLSKVRLNLNYYGEIRIADTFNIICDTKEGDGNNIVMIGSHLDSVPAGPGMVDNASGSSTVLEVFLKLYQLGLQKELVNKLRFAWWGAEELGLMGSRHYCREIKKDKEEFDKIVVYSNHDMLASPNYVPYIYKGASAPDPLKTGSTRLQSLYEVFFDSLPPLSKFSNNYELEDMTGGSDFFSFLEIGIPSGGLATGAGSFKTAEQRHKFGGLARAAYDPCYHQDCDTVENIATDVLEVMAKSVGFVVESLGKRENIREWMGSDQQ